jgi:hypothetical protein
VRLQREASDGSTDGSVGPVGKRGGGKKSKGGGRKANMVRLPLGQ